MTAQNITFTKKSLTNNTVEIDEINFPVGVEQKKITKIIIFGKEGSKLKNIINGGTKFKLTFDDAEVEEDEGPSAAGRTFTATKEDTGNTAEAGNFASASSSVPAGGATSAANLKQGKPMKNCLVVEENETLRIVYMKEDGSIKLETSSETDNQTGGGPGTKDPIPDKSNKPTPEEINQAKQALDNANTLDELNAAAAKIEELKNKGVVDTEFDTKIEATQDKLFNADKEGYRQNTENKIAAKLSEYEISESDLDDTEKTDFTKLKSKQITDKAQINEKETQIINNVKKKGTDKKWTTLRDEAQAAIKAKDKAKLTKVETELNNFIKDSKYSAKKSDAQSLLSQVKNANTGGGGGKGGKNEDTPFYRNPKIMIPVALGGVALIALAIWFVRSNRSSQEE